MAIKKSTPKPARPGGNPGGVVRQVISPSVSVLGKQILSGLPNPPRKSLTPAQLKEARALADRIKALEIKVANDKKANAKIIKEQNKKPLTTGRGATKPVTASSIGEKKKPVIKVRPRGGGLRGGAIGGGGLDNMNR
jgi:hypothetical protein